MDVTVTDPSGTSAITSADQYTYTAVTPPAVTSPSRTSGTEAGGTPVTITGTGFSGATVVDFGTTAATSRTVASDTTCFRVIRAHRLDEKADFGRSGGLLRSEFGDGGVVSGRVGSNTAHEHSRMPQARRTTDGKCAMRASLATRNRLIVRTHFPPIEFLLGFLTATQRFPQSGTDVDWPG
jgi:IPT/TIG domain